MEIENNISLGINSREYHYGVTPSLKINYKIEFINDLETNNLSYTNIIHKPDTALINKSLEKLEKNYQLLLNNMVNKIVDEDGIFVRQIYGDGNCYYRSLSFFLLTLKIIMIIFVIIYIIILNLKKKKL